jgi:hypothetical protein
MTDPCEYGLDRFAFFCTLHYNINNKIVQEDNREYNGKGMSSMWRYKAYI